MTSETTQQTIDALNLLLERERTALLNSDLDRLVAQYDEKKTLIDTLNGSDSAAAPQMKQLQARALRNQELLASALQGILSVANRMSALQRIRQSLDTYDESGQRRTIEGQLTRKMEKRA